jgi:hypothetical protein
MVLGFFQIRGVVSDTEHAYAVPYYAIKCWNTTSNDPRQVCDNGLLLIIKLRCAYSIVLVNPLKTETLYTRI